MQLTAVFYTILAATAVSAKEHNEKSNSTMNGDTGEKEMSTKAECRMMEKLQATIKLADNTTMLSDVTNNNQTKIDKIKAKAAKAQTQLTQLQSNTTLMTACEPIIANDMTVMQCKQMKSVERAQKLASNDTALAKHFEDNQTMIADFKTKVEKEATMLQSMQSNNTLLQACAVQNDISSCKMMTKMEKEIARANNATSLAKASKNNATKADNIKAKAVKLQSKLDEMKGNTTLMDTCNNLAQGKSTSGSSTTGNTSVAGRIEAVSGMIAASLFAILAGMLMM